MLLREKEKFVKTWLKHRFQARKSFIFALFSFNFCIFCIRIKINIQPLLRKGEKNTEKLAQKNDLNCYPETRYSVT